MLPKTVRVLKIQDPNGDIRLALLDEGESHDWFARNAEEMGSTWWLYETTTSWRLIAKREETVDDPE